MTHSKALTFSVLGPAPVLFYVDAADAYGVAWAGILMGRAQAMQIAAFMKFKIAATPRARQISLKEFRKIYKCGGFGDKAWGLDPDNWSYVTNTISKNKDLADYVRKSQPDRLLGWFTDENAIRGE